VVDVMEIGDGGGGGMKEKIVVISVMEEMVEGGGCSWCMVSLEVVVGRCGGTRARWLARGTQLSDSQAR